MLGAILPDLTDWYTYALAADLLPREKVYTISCLLDESELQLPCPVRFVAGGVERHAAPVRHAGYDVTRPFVCRFISSPLVRGDEDASTALGQPSRRLTGLIARASVVRTRLAG